MNDSRATIGIPVYNEARFIERTLRSAMGQADEIIISDNASTDGTSEICAKFSSESGVNYIRHDKNRGSVFNFNYVLDKVSNPYFMWLGGHDLLPVNHVKKLKSILDDTPDAVLAYSNSVHLTSEYVFKKFYKYDFSTNLASVNPACRVFSIISELSDCSIYQGLYRTETIKKASEYSYNDKYIGIDHGVLGEVAAIGRMILCDDTMYYRIEPREDDKDSLKSWERVLQAIYNEEYDDKIHFPELIPIGICYIHLRTAHKVAKFSNNPEHYIRTIKNRLSQRFGYNDVVNEYIYKNFDIQQESFFSRCINRCIRKIKRILGLQH